MFLRRGRDGYCGDYEQGVSNLNSEPSIVHLNNRRAQRPSVLTMNHSVLFNKSQLIKTGLCTISY